MGSRLPPAGLDLSLVFVSGNEAENPRASSLLSESYSTETSRTSFRHCLFKVIQETGRHTAINTVETFVVLSFPVIPSSSKVPGLGRLGAFSLQAKRRT